MKKRIVLRITAVSLLLISELLFTLLFSSRYAAVTGGKSALDMAPIFGTEALLEYVRSLSAEAVRVYTSMQVLDLIFPLVYTFTLILFIPGKPGSRWVYLTAIAGMAFDYCENLVIYRLLHFGTAGIITPLLPWITLLKFSCIGITLLAVILHRVLRR